MHEGVEARLGIFRPLVGKVAVEHRGFELRGPQGALDEPRMHAGFQQMGGVRMSEGMDGHPGFGEAGSLFGDAAGAWDTGATQRGSRRRTLGVLPPGGGKKPSGVPMSCPVGAKPREGISGQGNVAVFGALATMDMDLEALAIDIGGLKRESFVEPEAQAIDRGKGGLVGQRGGRREERPNLLDTEDGGEPVFGSCTQERQGVPVALEDVLREEAETTVADAHGRWGEAVDVCAVQEITLQLLFSNAVGRLVIALCKETDFTDVRCLRPFALATELERRNHLLTQWGHERSPFIW